MAKRTFTELDFAEIKQNLKEFLSSQSRFADYNFEGSGLSILLDILAYNTQYTAYYASMVANEMFLDSAILRNSVVSRAKMLGYIPRSKTSAVAYVTIQLLVNEAPLPAYVTIPSGTTFSATNSGTTYNFYTDESYVVYKNSSDQYISDTVKLVEGKELEYRFIVDTYGNPDQRYIIPNASIDTALLHVSVLADENTSVEEVFTLAEDINDVDGDSTIFFLQEVDDQKFEILFGDDILGKAVTNGQVILVRYTVSSGADGNGCITFTANSPIASSTSVITLVEASTNGTDEESIESIKSLAPRFYQAQNRAVTRNDYETLLLADYSYLDAVKVWGGEDNDPPTYGKVFISIKPSSGLVLSERTRAALTEDIIRTRNLVTVEPIIVDPDYTKLVITSTVKYDSRLTTKTSGTLQNDVIATVVEFNIDEINNFGNSFRYSKFVKAIDDTDTSILGNLTSIKLKATFTPDTDTSTQYEIAYNNEIVPGSITSNAFTYAGYTGYWADDSNGVLYIYRLANGTTRTITGANMGTVDYTTGKIVIDAFLPSSSTDISITATPVSYDVAPLRNQILLIQDEDITITMVDEATSL